jgi:hypothetical protein
VRHPGHPPARGHPRRVPPAFGTAQIPRPVAQPPEGAVLGDPLSVPEAPITPAEPAEPEPLWLKLPAELATYFDIGFSHGDIVCPSITLRMRDDTTLAPVEVCGPPSAFLGLAQIIATLCESVPCMTHETAYAETQSQAG